MALWGCRGPVELCLLVGVLGADDEKGERKEGGRFCDGTFSSLSRALWREPRKLRLGYEVGLGYTGRDISGEVGRAHRTGGSLPILILVCGARMKLGGLRSSGSGEVSAYDLDPVKLRKRGKEDGGWRRCAPAKRANKAP